MNLIYCLKKGKLSFGDKVIFADLELSLVHGDKVCLIGRNGCGKSSLLKVICQEYAIDYGEVFTDLKCSIGYLKQDVEININLSIYDFTLGHLPDPASSKYLADIILAKLALTGDTILANCSGGQIRRAHLAKVLVAQPEILLLDEPTNHLDIQAIKWLEEYIKSYQGAVVCISHDRALLANVTNKIWWLDRGMLRKSDRGFKYFNQWQESLLTQDAANVQKLRKKLATEHQWLNTGVTARRKRNQQRLDNLTSLRQTIKQQTQKLAVAQQKLSTPLPPATAKTNFIIEADSISFAHSGKQAIINNFSFRVKKGEKIGIIGANGSGKSTFINLLLGKIVPQSGKITYGTNLNISAIDQHRSALRLTDTLEQTLCPTGGNQIFLANKTIHVGAYLKKFTFDPQLLTAKVSILSGGEANRLLLAKTLINPGNLLILDEPTNDLDIDSLEMLLTALSEYRGTLIIVSHDRDFLNRLVTRTLVFTGSKIIDIAGGYKDYQNSQPTSNSTNTVAAVKSDLQQLDVSQTKKLPTKKLSYKDQRLLAIIPTEIQKLELKISSLENKLSDSNLYLSSPLMFHEITTELKKSQDKIEELTNQWLAIA